MDSHEESIIPYVFVANMRDEGTQRALLRKKRNHKKARELAINKKVGTQNQVEI